LTWPSCTPTKAYWLTAKYVLSRNATEKDVRKLGQQIAKDLAQVEAGGIPKH
jgi:hypothetical protein